METTKPLFQKYLLICENKRDEGQCCAPEGEKIRELLKDKIKALGLKSQVRVSRAGCLDVCKWGPNVLLMPDNVWFKEVHEKDIDAIIEKATTGLSKK
ncbi:MAG: (2Fe-2S) ferredoxin domain-containing protein [Deltaproteobacteria bacterium]|nr:(2Fe-2S) ferredoxin domain-containing protein [Deltaproteobacteria bacterium]